MADTEFMMLPIFFNTGAFYVETLIDKCFLKLNQRQVSKNVPDDRKWVQYSELIMKLGENHCYIH